MDELEEKMEEMIKNYEEIIKILKADKERLETTNKLQLELIKCYEKLEVLQKEKDETIGQLFPFVTLCNIKF